ncbi:hypothetical protein [Aquibacillus kalidii]|uniref:hypothetical protein n=1 Tax=Aquibacillus kalidii TaxID=2762597 RepID=UPI00164659F1|nr:hypothetical protein [Aquibacillus kalidii]
MEFFLYDLVVAQNIDSKSDEELEKLEDKWMKNLRKYNEIYGTLSERLPQDIFNHFNSWGFHDYQLVKMEIEHTSLLHSDIHFTLSNNNKWRLSFEDVSFFQFKHLNYDNNTPIFNREVDSWLYEEFLPFDESTLSFEVTFSSGGNILLHFPDKSVSLKKINGT